jgi:multicomponent Na+:H+ antiporter subunit D
MSEQILQGLPPGAILIVGALLVPVLRGWGRQLFMLALPVLGFLQLLALPEGFSSRVEFLSYELQIVRIDALSLPFGYVFYLVALLSLIYAMHVKDTAQQVAALVYAGSAIAGVFVGDLVGLFVCWEATAVASVFLIWARRTNAALRSGMRYLVIQVGSGVLLLAGTLQHLDETGSLAFDHLGLDTPGGKLIFLAFGIKAAFPLLHNWLQDAYPNATITGTVFLSAFTTKLAIYALARGYAGTEILIPIGAAMTAFPIFYAVIENDLRRVLAYSLNNQLGFMVVGIGIGTQLALNGTVAHVFAHVIYKALLFMAMGAVLLRAGTIKASQLGGLYKSMPLSALFCIVGAVSISAFPLTSGFVSKSMVLSASAEEHYTIAFFVLLFASGGVLHHSGIKIPYYGFFGHDRGIRVREAPWNMLVAMGVAAALCLGIGIFPEQLYRILPYPVDYAPYTASHVVTTLQLLLFAVLAFVFLVRTGRDPPELRSIVLDSDWVYRRLLPGCIGVIYGVLSAIRSSLSERYQSIRVRLLAGVEDYHGPWGPLGEPWPSGATAMWAAVLLLLYLLFSYCS